MYYQILQLLQQLHNVKKVQLHIASAIIQEHTCIGTRKTCHIMSLSLQVLSKLRQWVPYTGISWTSFKKALHLGPKGKALYRNYGFKQTIRQVQPLVFDSMMQHEFWSAEVIKRRIWATAYSNWSSQCQALSQPSWRIPKPWHYWTLEAIHVILNSTYSTTFEINPWRNLTNRKALLDTSDSWLFCIHQISPGQVIHHSDQAITSEAQIHDGFRKVSQLRHFVAKASGQFSCSASAIADMIWSDVLTYNSSCNEM